MTDASRSGRLVSARGLRIALVAVWLLACGDDWNKLAGVPESYGFVDVWAFSEESVWFVDGGAVVHRYDGDEFSTLETPSLGGLLCLYALSATEVYLCAGSEILHYDGSSFTVMDFSATGLDSSTAIWASSSSDIWVVGDDALVAHYDGTSWSRSNIGSSFNSSIWGSGPEDIYAMGTFDLVHFDGSSWSEVSVDDAGDGQVWGTSSSDVWVMSDSYTVSHYDGSSWQTMENDDFVGDLAAVWGPSPDDLWAAGSAGSIAHYDGGSWDEVTHQRIGAPYLRMFVAIHGSSSSDVWAVGHQLGEGGSTGIIYHGP